MLVEMLVMFLIQHHKYWTGIDNLLVLLIGCIPIFMPTDYGHWLPSTVTTVGIKDLEGML
jgi:hypothetical protein